MENYVFAYPWRIYYPAHNVITNITNAKPAVVTTATDHNYVDGMVVRLVIAAGYGMPQANRLMGIITIINPTSFSITIDTTSFDPYVIPSPALQTSQTIGVGDENDDGTGYMYNAAPFI